MSNGYGMGVVIATARRERLLRETLDSLASARLPATFQEVLVVENGARGGTQEVVESFAPRLPVRYMFVPAPNKCRALNHALREAAAPFIYFLDDDVRLDADAVEAYADAAARYGPGHHFSGPLVPAWEVEPHDWLKGYLPRSATGWDHGDREKYYDKPDFIGSNWAAFRADMLAVGGFSEDIGPGTPSGAIGDESELQQRLLDAGGRGVYLPAARVWHHVPRSDCSFDWARDRQHRMGVTYGFLGWPPEWGPIPPGLAGWWQLGLRMAKVSVARALRWSEERRVYVEMTGAYARGYLKGRRLARHRGRSG
jgi:glucosyl-dolichyl phosphate glucuronosyltransferase